MATNYKVICISLYTTDVERLAAKVAELRRRGRTKMSKSELIRIALDRLDVDGVEPDPDRTCVSCGSPAHLDCGQQ